MQKEIVLAFALCMHVCVCEQIYRFHTLWIWKNLKKIWLSWQSLNSFEHIPVKRWSNRDGELATCQNLQFSSLGSTKILPPTERKLISLNSGIWSWLYHYEAKEKSLQLFPSWYLSNIWDWHNIFILSSNLLQGRHI